MHLIRYMICGESVVSWVKTWTMVARKNQRIETFEMCCRRQLFTIPKKREEPIPPPYKIWKLAIWFYLLDPSQALTGQEVRPSNDDTSHAYYYCKQRDSRDVMHYHVEVGEWNQLVKSSRNYIQVFPKKDVGVLNR